MILSGTGTGGFQSDPWLDWVVLWRVFAAGLWAAAIGLAVWFVRLVNTARPTRSTEVLVGMATVIALGLAAWATVIEPVSAASMRILWQLMKATLAGLILLAGCRVLFKQQGGTFLLHIGVILLLLSELHTGLTAREFSMPLAEGERTNYVSDIRTAEFAVVRDAEADDGTPEEVHTVVPVGRLEEGETFSDPALPFEVEVLEYHPNATYLARANVEREKPRGPRGGRGLLARAPADRHRRGHEPAGGPAGGLPAAEVAGRGGPGHLDVRGRRPPPADGDGGRRRLHHRPAVSPAPTARSRCG